MNFYFWYQHHSLVLFGIIIIKKIIQNKLEADESTREVRSQIKSYIDQKQNVREGFTETFKPLIETSEAVITSIDTQQNKLIQQLQDNQLALTEGLEEKL